MSEFLSIILFERIINVAKNLLILKKNPVKSIESFRRLCFVIWLIVCLHWFLSISTVWIWLVRLGSVDGIHGFVDCARDGGRGVLWLRVGVVR
jgi:hypothetical protein